jgi:phosphoribosyl-AMP cyclohydrolase
MKALIDIDNIKFDDKGLIPAIAQDASNGEVLMLAYMNRESLEITLKEGKACYYSRSRKKLWLKGETSGHFQFIKEMFYDCDSDAILMKIEQIGPACHTGERSCFHRSLAKSEK